MWFPSMKKNKAEKLKIIINKNYSYYPTTSCTCSMQFPFTFHNENIKIIVTCELHHEVISAAYA